MESKVCEYVFQFGTFEWTLSSGCINASLWFQPSVSLWQWKPSGRGSRPSTVGPWLWPPGASSTPFTVVTDCPWPPGPKGCVVLSRMSSWSPRPEGTLSQARTSLWGLSLPDGALGWPSRDPAALGSEACYLLGWGSGMGGMLSGACVMEEPQVIPRRLIWLLPLLTRWGSGVGPA